MSNVTNYLTPEEINAYQTRRQGVNTVFGRQRANLDYQRDISGQDYGIGNTRIARSWDKAYKSLPANFARRGILRSGIYNQAYKDYGTDRQNANFDWELQNMRRMSGFQNQQDDYEANRTMQLAQIEAEQLARQSRLAAEIQARQ